MTTPEGDYRLPRLQRKLALRDKKIAALRRHIAELESALASHAMTTQRLPIDVRRAVQEALCNVRMIPVLGVRQSDRIVEVRALPPDKLNIG